MKTNRADQTRPRKPRPTATGFSDLPNTRLMVRCDYCGRLCRRRGISGHKQHCGGWRREYAQAPAAASREVIQ